MKHIFVFLIAFAIFSCLSSKPVSSSLSFAQSQDIGTSKKPISVFDSLSYMKDIIANKDKYINQPFSVLLNDLKMPVKSYQSRHSNRIENDGIRISFDNVYITTAKDMNYPAGYKNPVGLNIEWVSQISRKEVDSNLTNEAGEWAAAEQKYYSSKIVGDIIPWFINNNK